MLQKAEFDVDLCVKHLKQIARTVQCSCSAFYLKAYTCECGYILCDSCWRLKKSCPNCRIMNKLQNCRQNEHLEKRFYHIKELIDAFRIVAPTADNIIEDVCIELDNTNKTIFEPVQKENRTYVNKRNNKPKANLNDRPSVSQNESELIFPGEVIVISSDNQGRNNKSGSLENVKNWLQATQNQFSERTDSQLENMNIVSNIPVTETKSASRGTCNIPVNQNDWDKIEVLESETIIEPKKDTSDTSFNLVPAEISSNEVRRSARNKAKDTDKVTTRRKSIKSAHKIVTDQITIENCLEPVKTKADVSNNSNANSSMEKKLTSKKEMWSNVKKMKQDFNKTSKRKVKKLNISIGSVKKSESVVSRTSLLVEDVNMKQSPYIIEDSTPATPISLSSYEKVIDKDREACLQVLQESEQNHTNDSIESGPPLPYCDLIDGADKQDKIRSMLTNSKGAPATAGFSLLEKTRGKVSSSAEALKQAIPCKVENPVIDTSIGRNVNTNSVLRNSVADLDLPPVFLQRPISFREAGDRKKQSLQNNRFPFIKRGKILGKCFYPNRKVPFYYKHQCRVPKTNVFPNPKQGNFIISVEKGNMKTYIKISNTDIAQRNSSKVSLQRSTGTGQGTSKNDKFDPMPAIVLSKSNSDIAPAISDKVSDVMKNDTTADILKANQPILSLKKATESAETVTVVSAPNAEKADKDIETVIDAIVDCDIFNSASVVGESNNVIASGIVKQPSEILPNTIQNNKTQTIEKDTQDKTGSKKRGRKLSESQSPLSKKHKRGDDLSLAFHSENALEKESVKSVHEDSELMNYDEIIGKVLANIDAEIEENAKDKRKVYNEREHTISEHLDVEMQSAGMSMDTNVNLSPHKEIETDNVNKLYSENMFSTVHEKVPDFKSLHEEDECIIEEEIPEQSTGVLSRKSKTELDVTNEHDLDEDHFAATPKNIKTVTGDEDASDNSVVEDTPQKPKKSKFSIANAKSVSRDSQQNKDMSVDNRSVQSSLRLKQGIDKVKFTAVKKSSSISQDIRSLLNESVEACDRQQKNVTELVDKIATADLEVASPLNITKFTTDIKHNSTPMHPNARKLLDFNKQRMEKDGISQSGKENMGAESLSNVELTLLTRKTSLEKDMIQKEFITPSQPGVSAQRSACIKFTLACSCLQPVQITNVKILALRKGWNYINQYSPSLTHLIVGVDERNASQRSVKYMRALAAGKWIVSYDWILQSLKEDKVVNEGLYEVLDNTGAMGPKWSRMATKKLFTGITFFCMPPFTVLDENALSHMLEDAGGTVVKTIEEISLKSSKNISLLLAEPESTQEDRFIYIAVNHSIVPVNFEWALNSLGCYELTSIRNLLLCPESLVRLDKLNWPKPLVDVSNDELDYNTCE